MIKESVIRTVAIIIITLCLPVFLTATVLRAEINEPRLYYWSVSQPDVLRTTGISQIELEQASLRLIDYFNSEVASPQMEVTRQGKKVQLFNERELLHLEDVRGLVQLDYRIQIIAGFLIGICLALLALAVSNPIRSIGTALISGTSLTLVLALALAAISAVEFDLLFWQFHVVSFSNLMWQLDPSRDHLIQMFPQSFWYAAAMLLLGMVIACAGGLLALGRWLSKAG